MLPDKDLIKQRFRRCLPTYNQHATVQRKMSNKLVNLINIHAPNYNLQSVMDIGCGTGIFLNDLLRTFEIDQIIINDLVEDCFDNIAEIIKELSPSTNAKFIPGDAEKIRTLSSFDLIGSNATLQWMVDLPSFIERCYTSLRPDGILGFTTFGPENFREFRLTDNASLAYLSLEKLKDIIGENFQILHASEETHTLTFPTPFDVLKHLRFTGVTGTRKALWTKEKLERFTIEYKERFSEGSNVTLTYNPIYIVAGK